MHISKLEDLRSLMRTKDIQAFIQPYTDPHQSEYIPEFWQTRKWLTGFSGSAGTAVVTHTHAGLWTDGRYFLQAKTELVPPFELHELKTRGPEYIEWLINTLDEGSHVGIDAQLVSVTEFKSFQNKFEVKSIKLIDTGDLMNGIWENRPSLKFNPILPLSEKLTGQSTHHKLETLRTLMREIGANYYLVSALDSIAYLLNIRGSDIAYNPVVVSFCLVTENNAMLFTDAPMLDSNIAEYFETNQIKLFGYTHVVEEINSLPANSTIWCDSNTINQSLFTSIPKHCSVIEKSCPIVLQKAIKNKVEIDNYRWAQIRDGIAVCSFLEWLERHCCDANLTEINASQKLEKFRSVQPNYVGPSFETISAFGANGAFPHYHCDAQNPTTLEAGNLFLIDSGAQYTQGTTDITRTIALGKPTNEQIRNFTLVLKGHIRLARCVFPYGTKGYQLDALARYDLWQESKNFGHGTGHGIGYYLNVHEGPQGISSLATGNSTTVIEPGMLITNEPGLYIPGEYGIRTENVMLCVEAEQNQFGRFLKFETLSWAPIDQNLIDVNSLNSDELEWLNQYHQMVYKNIGPRVCQQVKEWLLLKTQPLK